MRHHVFSFTFNFLVGTVHLHHVSLIIHPSNRAERERIEMPTNKQTKESQNLLEHDNEPRSQLLKKEVKTYLSTQSSVFISSMAEALISSREGQDASQLLKSEGLEGFLEGFLFILEGSLFFLEGFLSFLDFFLEFWRLGLDFF